MANIFTDDKAPYLFTLIVGIFVWGITHIADRIADSPIILYTDTTVPKGANFSTTYTISNITDTKLFEDLDFFVIVDSPDNIKSVMKILLPPIKQEASTDSFDQKPTYVKYHMASLQPKNVFKLVVIRSGKEDAPLRCHAKNPVVLTKPTWESSLLENEIEILVALSVACFVVISIYILAKIFS
jgi:hypothetical protein